MCKPSEVIATAIELEAYAPQFVGCAGFDYYRYQPFLCNVIKHHGAFGKHARYRAVHAIRSKLDGHETLFSFWLHNVRADASEQFSAAWAMQFWRDFITELQSDGL